MPDSIYLLRLGLDTSSYPNDHSYICFALDDVAPNLLPVVEAVGAYPSKPLDATVNRMCKSLALALAGGAPEEQPASQPLQSSHLAKVNRNVVRAAMQELLLTGHHCFNY